MKLENNNFHRKVYVCKMARWKVGKCQMEPRIHVLVVFEGQLMQNHYNNI